MFEDSFIEVDPSSVRQIPSSWWDHVLSGHLWFIDLDTWPFHISVEDFRHLCYRRARQRGMNISVATSLPSRKVFVQRVPVRGAPTWSRDYAQLAPQVPKIKVLNYKEPVTPAPAWVPPAPPTWTPPPMPGTPTRPEALARGQAPGHGQVLAFSAVKWLPPEAVALLTAGGYVIGEDINAVAPKPFTEADAPDALGDWGMPPAAPEELPWPTQPGSGQE